MGILDKIKQLVLTKSEKPHTPTATSFTVQPKPAEAAPPQFIAPVPIAFTPAPVVEKPKPLSFTVAKPHRAPKIRVLRTFAKLMLVLDIVVAAFFTSTNMMLNAAIYAYMGLNIVLLGHYLSVSK